MDTSRLTTVLPDAVPPTPPRRRRSLAVLGALALVAVLVVVGVLRWPPSGTASLPSCGSVPVSDGPHRDSLRATLTAPASAPAGSQIEATINVHATGPAQDFSSGQPPDLLVVLGDRVVGRYRGAVAGTGAGGSIGPDGETYAASGLLSACLSTVRSTLGDTDAQREPLPPGVYSLVATMADDGNGDGTGGVLVSQPVPITVTG